MSRISSSTEPCIAEGQLRAFLKAARSDTLNKVKGVFVTDGGQAGISALLSRAVFRRTRQCLADKNVGDRFPSSSQFLLSAFLQSIPIGLLVEQNH